MRWSGVRRYSKRKVFWKSKGILGYSGIVRRYYLSKRYCPVLVVLGGSALWRNTLATALLQTRNGQYLLDWWYSARVRSCSVRVKRCSDRARSYSEWVRTYSREVGRYSEEVRITTNEWEDTPIEWETSEQNEVFCTSEVFGTSRKARQTSESQEIMKRVRRYWNEWAGI